jgi:dTDP-4-dehydrorhamnose reductase
VYSKTKADAEAALKGVPGALVLRSAVIYGTDYGHGKTNFAAWLLGELKARRPVRIVRDQWNNPTLPEMIADFASRAIDRKLEGTLHAASGECLARDEFARRIAQRFDLDAALITPVTTEVLKQRAKRPLRSCLSMAKSEAALGLKAWSTGEALDLMHKQLSRGTASGPQPWW